MMKRIAQFAGIAAVAAVAAIGYSVNADAQTPRKCGWYYQLVNETCPDDCSYGNQCPCYKCTSN